TQRYCRGDFTSWDPKITTLPGLYLLALPARPLLRLLASISHKTTPGPVSIPHETATPGSHGETPEPFGCSARELRLLNALLGVAIACVTGRIVARVHPRAPPAAVNDARSGVDKASVFLEPSGVVISLVLSRVAGVALFPVMNLFFFLFYTDAAAVLCTLAMLEAALASRYMLSAALGAVAGGSVSAGE
ncbi:hypothetical protein T484DRAFT_1867601, partial [Baffinella frigidus]